MCFLLLFFFWLVTSQSPTHNSSSSTISCTTNDWKLRKPMTRTTNNSASDFNSRRHNQSVNSISGSGLHQSRTKTIHQSNGSIHSDSPSSSSISPAPSPSPRPQLLNAGNGGGSGLGKRWSSTGDFGAQSPLTGR